MNCSEMGFCSFPWTGNSIRFRIRRIEVRIPPPQPGLVLTEKPTNGGLLRIGSGSLGSEIGRFRPEIADSLRPIFEILPF